MAATLSSDEMKGIIEDANLRTVREMADEDGIVPVMMPETDEDGNPIPDDRPQRNVLVVACGDGGCNIGTAIVCAVPDDAYVIAVNSSDRNLKTDEPRGRRGDQSPRGRYRQGSLHLQGPVP